MDMRTSTRHQRWIPATLLLALLLVAVLPASAADVAVADGSTGGHAGTNGVRGADRPVRRLAHPDAAVLVCCGRDRRR